jgi:hypothetical protein
MDGECLGCFLLVLRKSLASHRQNFLLPVVIDQIFVAACFVKASLEL